MSDETIKELIAGVVMLGSLGLNLLITKKVAGVGKEVVTVKEKVDTTHDLVNSKSVKQEKMIRALAKAEQKVEDAINGKHKILPDKKKVPIKKRKNET